MQQDIIKKIDTCIAFLNEETDNLSPWMLAMRSSKLRRLGISKDNQKHAKQLLMKYRLLILRDEYEEGLISKRRLQASYEFDKEYKEYQYKRYPQPDDATALLPIDPNDFERLISNDLLLGAYGSEMGNRLLRLDRTSRIIYSRLMAGWSIKELSDEYDVSENKIVWTILMCNLVIRRA